MGTLSYIRHSKHGVIGRWLSPPVPLFLTPWRVFCTTAVAIGFTRLFTLCNDERAEVLPWYGGCWETLVTQTGNEIQQIDEMYWKHRWSLEYSCTELTIHVPNWVVRYPCRRCSWRPDILYHYRQEVIGSCHGLNGQRNTANWWNVLEASVVFGVLLHWTDNTCSKLGCKISM